MACLPDVDDKSIRLLIVDDHAVVRQGLKHIFAVTGDVEVAGEASNGRQALKMLLAEPFDAALLDISMPDMNGLDLIMRIRSRGLDLPVIAFSMIDDPQVMRLALQAGASAYLTKASAPEMLIAAIEETVTSKWVATGSVKQAAAVRNRPHLSLSARERQIFRLLVSGKRVNDIAQELAISNKAVSTYKARLMQKMEFQSNAELVCYGLAHGIRE